MQPERSRLPFVPILLGGLGLAVLALVLLLRADRSRTETTSPDASRRTELAADMPAALPSSASDPEPAARTRAALPGAPEPPEPAPDDASRASELRGRVIDSGGAPIPGAEVAVERGIAREFSVLDLEAAHASERVAEALTDERGEFRFPLARGIPVDLAVSAPGFAETLVPDRYAGEFVEVTLSAGFVAFGRVTRERDGGPVADAEVRVFRLGGPSSLARETRTDADGRYELRFDFAESAMLEVTSANEQSSDWLPLDLGPDGRVEKDVALHAGVVVEGRVTDALTGSPIEGAFLGEGWVYRRKATTDARGEYRMPGFGSPGYGELYAKARGYGETKRADFPGAEDGVVRVDFELVPGRAARGRILDPSGWPIAGAYVAAVASQFGPRGQEHDWLSATTDEGGRFRIEGLAHGLRHALFARKHGFATHVWDFPAAELAESETDLGDLVLTPPGLVAGRVEDEAGRGLAGVEVSLAGSNHDRDRLVDRAPSSAARSAAAVEAFGYSGGSRSELLDHYVATRECLSDDRGAFSFGLVAAGSYELRARKRGWTEASPLAVEVAEGVDQEGLVLRLVGDVTLRGRVVDEEGQPVARVHLSPNPLPTGGGIVPSVSASARTDAEGRFEFRGLPEGEYRIDAYPFWIAEWEPDAPWLSTTVERVSTGTEDLVIVMEKGALIGGTLLDADGKPLFGYVVGLTGDVRTTGWLVTTDIEGRFTIAVPRATVCDVEVRAPRESGRTRVMGAGDGVLLLQPGVAAGTTDLVLQLGR